MKNTKKFLYILAGIFVMLGTSCNDDETYDFPGDPMNRVYMKSITSDFTFIHTPILSASSLDLKLPVYVTGSHSGVIKATVSFDSSLVDAYNLSNGTDYEALPDNALIIENATVSVPAGEYHSSDSVHITVNEDVLPQLRNESGYLIPLKVKNAEGNNVAVSTNMNCAYIPVSVNIKSGMINEDASSSDIQGALVEDRTGWSASLEESEGVTVSGDVQNLFDDDISSEWKLTSEQSFHVVFDLQKSYNVTAITALYSYYGWWNYCSFSGDSKLEYSQDGIIWEELGNVPAYVEESIILYAPVTMRYIRAEVPAVSSYWGNTASITIGDFNVYVK